jgi:hypothetical protein
MLVLHRRLKDHLGQLSLRIIFGLRLNHIRLLFGWIPLLRALGFPVANHAAQFAVRPADLCQQFIFAIFASSFTATTSCKPFSLALAGPEAP